MRKQKYYYSDMDGVLADFFGVKWENFATKPNFFYNLKPIQKNVDALIKLIENKNVSVRILSASPNKNCDQDKLRWLKKYIPQLKRKNIIIMRVGENKADYMKTKNGILFDDYNKNIDEWTERKNNIGYLITKENGIEKYL